MMAQKTESVTALTKGIEFLFKKNKVEWIKGWGRIDGPGKVVVKAVDGAETVLETKNIIIATGSEPTPRSTRCYRRRGCGLAQRLRVETHVAGDGLADAERRLQKESGSRGLFLSMSGEAGHTDHPDHRRQHLLP
eukprot:gene52488-71589_t